MQSTFRTLFKMTRPINIVIAIITLLIGYTLLHYFPSIPILIVQSLGFATAIGFANIQNDILDLESDKQNCPERPLVTGKVSVKTARKAWITLAIAMLVCGLLDTVFQCFHVAQVVGDWDNVLAFGLVGVFIISFPIWFFALLGALLTTYNRKLKHIPLLKNMTVAFLCTTPLLYAMQYYFNFAGSFAPEESLGKIMPAILFAFLLTSAREIYKDLEDETGDLKAGIMTFPLIAGAKTARRLAGAIILFTWISLPVPVFFMDRLFDYNYPPLFLVLTAATLTPSFAVIIWSAHRQNYHRAQSITKIAMFLGLVALLICALI